MPKPIAQTKKAIKNNSPQETPDNDASNILKTQLLQLVEEFSSEAKPLASLLGELVDDIDRALAEPLEIVPVAHHSPASAIHMLGRLQQRAPRVIFMEMCEDFLPQVESLKECQFPVAFQAFAGSSIAYPSAWMPLSVVAPLSPFSAEYQAMAFALQNPEVALVFVDRSVDHIFQWLPKEEKAVEEAKERAQGTEPETESKGEAEDEARAHGAALGIESGEVRPTLDAFVDALLRNAQVKHYAEWWQQYVEGSVIGASYQDYRRVFLMIGSLLRRLGRRQEDTDSDRLRERYMWTRMKTYLRANNIAASDALYICGAVHAVSDVEEFGTVRKIDGKTIENNAIWDIPARSLTPWLYGLIPSNFAAIEVQFGHPRGTITLASTNWRRSLKTLKLKPFKLGKEIKEDKDGVPSDATGDAPASKTKGKTKKTATAVSPPVIDQTLDTQDISASDTSDAGLLQFLTRPPALAEQDQDQLLGWCVNIVELARKNGYLATTADSIAIYQTSILLANIRNRANPSPYDFCDAAITCLEKDRTPKKRNIARLTEMLLGGNRLGMVGYDALPLLVRNIYDRLAPLKLDFKSTRVQRALLDLRANPELEPCSQLLWKLKYLLPDYAVRPIMGERKLGQMSLQESWDLAFGKYQGVFIQLAYDGLTVEQVLELRLRKKAFGDDATALSALKAVEDSLLFLESVRLTEDLGNRATTLLAEEAGADSAPEIFEQVRRLVHYYRSTPQGLPTWIKRFVATGYSHYATLLPAAFETQGTNPKQIASMLGFILTLESLALSLGCHRSQLLIAVQQAGTVTEDPAKLGLLWTVEWLLGLREVQTIREFFDRALDNTLMLPALPAYINGFLLSLMFAPQAARLTVELVNGVFGRLPDGVLLPWLPSLLVSLSPYRDELVPILVREAAASFPTNAKQLDGWKFPWERATASAKSAVVAKGPVLSAGDVGVRSLLFAQRASASALATALGLDGGAWQPMEAASDVGVAVGEALSDGDLEVQGLLKKYPRALEAHAKRLGL